MEEFRGNINSIIKSFLNIEVSNVPIHYIENLEFYKCIKRNFPLESEKYDNIERVKDVYRYYSKIIPGLYKWNEKAVFIKKEERFSDLIKDDILELPFSKVKDLIKRSRRNGKSFKIN